MAKSAPKTEGSDQDSIRRARKAQQRIDANKGKNSVKEAPGFTMASVKEDRRNAMNDAPATARYAKTNEDYDLQQELVETLQETGVVVFNCTPDVGGEEPWAAICAGVISFARNRYAKTDGLWWNYDRNPANGFRIEVGSITSERIADRYLYAMTKNGETKFSLADIAEHVVPPISWGGDPDDILALVEKKFNRVASVFVANAKEGKVEAEKTPGVKISQRWTWNAEQPHLGFSCTFKKFQERRAA